MAILPAKLYVLELSSCILCQKDNNQILCSNGHSTSRSIPGRHRSPFGHPRGQRAGRHSARRQRADRPPRGGRWASRFSSASAIGCGRRRRPWLFRADVDQALARIDDLARAAALLRSGEAGTLAIASHPRAGITLLPPVVSAFARKRPDVRMQLLTRNSDVVRGMFPHASSTSASPSCPIDATGSQRDTLPHAVRGDPAQ